MKILGIESSGLVASIAVMEDDNLLGEYTMNHKKTHSQTLLPMLDELVKMIELDLKTIDAIAVSKGPGSFTGLRIGSATAKGLGLALEKPIIPVETIDAMAYNLWGVEKLICPIMDARNRQVYTGLYTFKNGNLITHIPQCIVPITEIIENINQTGKEVIFLGDGVVVLKQEIAEHITVPYKFAPIQSNRQRAASVAALGAVLYQQGVTETAAEHKPDYLRVSQAERELKEKERSFQIC
ncbi:MAG: tRNA (adenosine(37)-N6)-threonylcarbamoyltransferase complex dimerization subunit type 1 TsaB [Lachnospiraceae bacterium]|nr:tRNA (adenosine(37)-N6)-threonylcarbamoyltransferase complex dimerization subunit type 1 TsaB [Lachnospiraceae bacterium]